MFVGKTVLVRTTDVKEKVENLSSAHAKVIDGILSKEEIEGTEERTIEEINDAQKTAVFVGRLSQNKNPQIAIQVMEELGEDFQKLIIGGGPLEEQIKKRAADSDVQVLGHVPHEKVLDILKKADLLILPSATEAYPTVVFEALALGCWVIATPVGILPDVDHDRLLLRERSQMVKTIECAKFKGDRSIDESVLSQYSFENYSSRTLEALQDAQ